MPEPPALYLQKLMTEAEIWERRRDGARRQQLEGAALARPASSRVGAIGRWLGRAARFYHRATRCGPRRRPLRGGLGQGGL